MNVSVPVMKPVIVLNKIFPMPLSVTMGVGNKEARYLKWLGDKFANDQDVARLLVRIYDTMKDYPGTIMKSSGVLGTMQVRVLRTFLAEHAEALSVLSGMISGNQVKSTTMKIPASVRSASASLESVDLDVVYGNVDEVSSTEKQEPVDVLKQLQAHPTLSSSDVSQLSELIRNTIGGQKVSVADNISTDVHTALTVNEVSSIEENDPEELLNENKALTDHLARIMSPTELEASIAALSVPEIKRDYSCDWVSSTSVDVTVLATKIESAVDQTPFTVEERNDLLTGLSDRIAVLRAEDEAVQQEQSINTEK